MTRRCALPSVGPRQRWRGPVVPLARARAVAVSLTLASLAAAGLSSAGVAHAQAPAAASAAPAFTLDRSARDAPPVGPRQRAVVDGFAAAYAGAGKPRIALWWNRVLSDRFSNEVVRSSRVELQRDGDGQRASASSTTWVATESERPSDLLERDLWQLETEFTRQLLDAGVQLIDRAVIMRLTAGRGDTAAQTQAIEVSALQGKADLFLELLLTRDPEAPLGWGFRGNLKEIRSGRTVGTLYLTALPELPPPGPARYRPRPGGYDLVPGALPTVSIPAIGQTLAQQLMRELTPRMRPS